MSRLLGISWVAVGNIVERVVARRLDGARFDALKRIGVAEFSYRKRHHYLTTVVDHDRRRVVWAGKGRSAETPGAFLRAVGTGRLRSDSVGHGACVAVGRSAAATAMEDGLGRRLGSGAPTRRRVAHVGVAEGAGAELQAAPGRPGARGFRPAPTSRPAARPPAREFRRRTASAQSGLRGRRRDRRELVGFGAWRAARLGGIPARAAGGPLGAQARPSPRARPVSSRTGGRRATLAGPRESSGCGADDTSRSRCLRTGGASANRDGRAETVLHADRHSARPA